MLNSLTNKEESIRPIGVFDSGIGGLTVVKELNKLMPNERIIYFGDTARVPYGNKSKETVIHYSLQIAYFLLKKKIKMLVVACNTASSVSLPTLKRHLHIPIIGVIEPGAKTAASLSANKKVGVIGTLGTVKSNSYKKALHKHNGGINVSQHPCPLFVQLAEEGWHNNLIAQNVANEYLKEFRNKKIDTLILGCTHYPLLRNVIQKSLGNKVELIDSGRETAKEVKRILEKRGLVNKHFNPKKNQSVFYVSDFPHKFKEISQRFLSKKLERVHKVIL
ncbi:MAG TPA: glutamate racemase [Ignavibacteria bacterium]|nr:glutamate racemase [Ignavibacteria bacterium]